MLVGCGDCIDEQIEVKSLENGGSEGIQDEGSGPPIKTES